MTFSLHKSFFLYLCSEKMWITTKNSLVYDFGTQTESKKTSPKGRAFRG